MLNNHLTRQNHRYRTGAIFLNFADNEWRHHACHNHCHFCAWAEQDYNTTLYPTDEQVSEFIKTVLRDEDSIVQLSGGGDPLFNFDKNKDKIIHLIEVIKANDIKYITLLSTNYTEVAKHWNNELQDITNYNFSIEDYDEYVANIIHILRENGRYVKISKVLNFYESIDEDAIRQYVETWTQAIPDIKITLRENFYIHCDREQFDSFYEQLRRDYPNVIMVHANIGMPVLLNNDVYTCGQVDKIILGE